jgi:hypothetical protein
MTKSTQRPFVRPLAKPRRVFCGNWIVGLSESRHRGSRSEGVRAECCYLMLREGRFKRCRCVLPRPTKPEPRDWARTMRSLSLGARASLPAKRRAPAYCISNTHRGQRCPHSQALPRNISCHCSPLPNSSAHPPRPRKLTSPCAPILARRSRPGRKPGWTPGLQTKQARLTTGLRMGAKRVRFRHDHHGAYHF